VTGRLKCDAGERGLAGRASSVGYVSRVVMDVGVAEVTHLSRIVTETPAI